MNVLNSELNHERLADRILYAMELALEQKDLDIAESLNLALEKAMTRSAGGTDFVERREYPERIKTALEELRALKG